MTEEPVRPVPPFTRSAPDPPLARSSSGPPEPSRRRCSRRDDRGPSCRDPVVPDVPIDASLPSPPATLSLPSSPNTWSLRAAPVARSLPGPVSRQSRFAAPSTPSFPPSAMITSAAGVPSSTFAPLLPRIVLVLLIGIAGRVDSRTPGPRRRPPNPDGEHRHPPAPNEAACTRSICASASVARPSKLAPCPIPVNVR